MPPKQCWKKVLNAKSAKVVNDILMTLIGINFKGFDNLMQILCFDSAQLSTGWKQNTVMMCWNWRKADQMMRKSWWNFMQKYKGWRQKLAWDNVMRTWWSIMQLILTLHETIIASLCEGRCPDSSPYSGCLNQEVKSDRIEDVSRASKIWCNASLWPAI